MPAPEKKSAAPDNVAPSAPETERVQTPLMMAIARYQRDIAKALIDMHCCPLEAKDKFGRTALHYAVSRNEKDCATVKALCAAGADINAPDDENATPLHSAVYVNNLPAAQHLISLGADINIRNHSGSTPLQLAKALYRGKDFIEALSPPSAADVPPAGAPAPVPPSFTVEELTQMKQALTRSFNKLSASGADADPATVVNTVQALLDVDVRLNKAEKGPKA